MTRRRALTQRRTGARIDPSDADYLATAVARASSLDALIDVVTTTDPGTVPRHVAVTHARRRLAELVAADPRLRATMQRRRDAIGRKPTQPTEREQAERSLTMRYLRVTP